MKIERLIGIITILLQKEKVTAPYLANRFEVSRRTINRDIEEICKAGIPLVTTQGYDGGISIAEGYKIDKTVFTKEELRTIFTGLKSMESVMEESHAQGISEKLSKKNNALSVNTNQVLIDLSSHYKKTLAPKIKTIQSALKERHILSFCYFSSKGETKRLVEPYYIVFQWSSWYLLGFCLVRKEFRLFKLNRLWELEETSKTFQPRQIPEEALSFDQYFEPIILLTALFEKSAKYRIIDEYGMDSFTETEDGKLLFQWSFTNKEYLLNWILGFGSQVKVVEPKELQKEILQQAKKMMEKYEERDS